MAMGWARNGLHWQWAGLAMVCAVHGLRWPCACFAIGFTARGLALALCGQELVGYELDLACSCHGLAMGWAGHGLGKP